MNRLQQQYKAHRARKGSTTQGLIHPARWEIPANPLRTLYASQVIAARTETAMNSSIPGRVILRLTIPGRSTNSIMER